MAQSGQVPIVVAQATRVYGISIPNPEAASLTRKVIRLSLVLLLLQATYSIYNTVALNQRDFVYFSFLGALIPMCGYFGAKYRNRGLVIAYSMCNCLTAVTMPLSLGFIGFAMHYLNKNIAKLCPDGPEGWPVVPNATANVYVNGEQLSCQDLYDFKDGSTSLYVFLIPVGIVSTVIACLSCTWGFRLANTRYFTVPITQFQTGAIATVASPAQTTTYTPPGQGFAVGAPAIVVQQQNYNTKAMPATVVNMA